MRATVGHEFFHPIQNVLRPGARNRQTSLWDSRGLCLYGCVVDVVRGGDGRRPKFLTVGPTRDAVGFYKQGLGLGCKKQPRHYGYGMATFMRFLTEKHGDELVQAAWVNVRNGPRYHEPADVLREIGVDLKQDWKAFAQLYMLGTSGLGWPLASADGPLIYKEGSPVTVAGTLPQLSASKYLIDFSPLASASTRCRCAASRCRRGSASTASSSTNSDSAARNDRKIVDIDADLDPKFAPTATNNYVLIVTNINDTAQIVDGYRFGANDAFEVSIECGDQKPLLRLHYDLKCPSTRPRPGSRRTRAGCRRTTRRTSPTARNGTTYTGQTVVFGTTPSFTGSYEFSTDFKMLKRLVIKRLNSNGSSSLEAEIVNVPLNTALSTTSTSYYTLNGTEANGHIASLFEVDTDGVYTARCTELVLNGGIAPFVFGVQLPR